ncbi:Glycogen recognition site of AMP-activated protein kinase [Fibrobacter sp. UWB15]|uniref:glycogen-binding domain-containing protein n=1 Tax=unclassified Fibrobacter TaxID=2634177 RepID=UPI0009184CC3|nr:MULTISPECIES: glycogen-binding domain-containing protein [unclassified Fibrobacter]PWJ63184.1 AMP-activated protein kinase-like protein [Fibrobacter sp. UWB6]SHG42049.1 Glycogen recognition site of AMP-activated protein kinase [Fibrobacter sp. UWB8]SMG38482.1 Glycogen recognition site of AMP-activated protein kinase [Fibrobacter sp. UWB15]
MSKGTKTVVAKAAAKKVAAKAAPKAAAKPAAEKKAPASAAKKTAAKPAAEKKTAAKPAAKKTAPKAVAKPAAPKAAAKAPKKVTVVFEANCPLATTVSVAGSFNNWAVDKDMLKKDKKTGLWTGKVTLDAGDYEYKFVCDGQYWDEGDNKVKHV